MKRLAEIGWDSVVEEVWRDMGESQREKTSMREWGGYTIEAGDEIETRGKQSLRQKANGGEHLNIPGQLREGAGMDT